MSVFVLETSIGHSGDECGYAGCSSVATFKSGCNMRNCPDGQNLRKACDTHMCFLCNPVEINGW